MTDKSTSQSLLVLGTILFLIGLINGALIQTFLNPRMGLSAHLAGVQNALVLWAFGLMWSRVSLPRPIERFAAWSAIYGMYSIWLGLAIAGAFGASRSLPIAGAGYKASAGVEAVVAGLVYSGSVTTVIATVLLLVGLRRKQP